MFEKQYLKIIEEQNQKGLKNLNDYSKFLYYIENHNVEFLNISKQKLDNFYKNSYKITNKNLILQSKLIEIPQDLILYVLNTLKFYFRIPNEIIKQNFLKTKYKNNIKNKKFPDIHLFYFDFLDDNKIDQCNITILGNVQKQVIEIYRTQFKQSIGSSYGAIKNLDQNTSLMFLNKNSGNLYSIIYHQLSHYIQENFGLQLTSSTNISKNKNPKLLQYFQISFEDLQYYFNQKQFLPHIKDLIFGLKKLYQFNYTNISKLDFLYQLNVLPTKQKIKDQKFFINYRLINEDTAPLVMYCCSYILKHKFQKINSLISNRFLNSFQKN